MADSLHSPGLLHAPSLNQAPIRETATIRSLRRTPKVVAWLVILLLASLTAGSLALNAAPGGTDESGVCSAGCHEARPGPPPVWHTYHEGRAGAPGSPAARTPTSLSLSPSSWAVSDEMVNLMAVLLDARGTPIHRAEVRFYIETEFVGTRGLMEIGSTRTDSNGVALLTYQPTLAAERQTVVARFEGQGTHDASQKAVEIRLVEPSPVSHAADSSGLEGAGRGMLVAFVLAMVGVWAAFGYVLWQVYAIYRGDPIPTPGAGSPTQHGIH